MRIMELQNPWRARYQLAYFRSAYFHVETDARQGGRRVAVHQYPKRNTPYAEDMGRSANRFLVQGYLIGPTYWDAKNILIGELEKDGPGRLRLPLPYQMADVTVMVMSYTVTEARERGGYCTIEMDFVEYGDPNYRQQVSTTAQIDKSASNIEGKLTDGATTAADPYARVYESGTSEEAEKPPPKVPDADFDVNVGRGDEIQIEGQSNRRRRR